MLSPSNKNFCAAVHIDEVTQMTLGKSDSGGGSVGIFNRVFCCGVLSTGMLQLLRNGEWLPAHAPFSGFDLLDIQPYEGTHLWIDTPPPLYFFKMITRECHLERLYFKTSSELFIPLK